jgi:predicted alpha/beta superfamily hydrolase
LLLVVLCVVVLRGLAPQQTPELQLQNGQQGRLWLSVMGLRTGRMLRSHSYQQQAQQRQQQQHQRQASSRRRYQSARQSQHHNLLIKTLRQVRALSHLEAALLQHLLAA